MAQLAIVGHETRDEEVIEILEMVGGYNLYEYVTDNNCFGFYIDEETRNIYYDWVSSCYEDEDMIVFTLEEFLEKFPYRVGDKVTVKGLSEYPKSIDFMKWFDGNVHYSFDSKTWFLPEALQPYKEEIIEGKITMKEDKGTLVAIDLTLEFKKANEIEVILGDYEFVLKDGKTYFVKKNKYPKTYEECCDVLKIPNDERYVDMDVPLEYNKLLSAFTKLLICRDAYWKIAGEEIGLGKPWEPDWLDTNTQKYCIYYIGNKIKKQPMLEVHHFLAFPTTEMRDAFYEYFKDLIESCKEFL